MNRDGAPVSFGKKWSSSEDTELLTQIADNIEIEQIAELHARTVGGITSRIKTIAFRLNTEGVPISEISSKTKLSEADITEFIKKEEEYQAKRRKTIVSTDTASNREDTSHIKYAELITELKFIKNEIRMINTNMESLFKLLGTIINN